MSNLEAEPAEVVATAETETAPGLELIEPRLVPLGGPRAMTVRRTLPQRARSLIGAWCFLDHYGPDDVSTSGGMFVPPHPHTGLQTVSWLFQGEIEHRDSTGAHQLVRPGELNLMTAGRGIQHSEVSTPATRLLHGVQLWTVQPDADRFGDPFFEHTEPDAVRFAEATVRVFVGALPGVGEPAGATVFSPLVAAQLDLPAGITIELPVDPAFEHGILLDAGELLVAGQPLPEHHLGYLAPGRTTIELTAGTEPVRALLIGGEPFAERIVMWWNFIGRDHDEIVSFRTRWQAEAIELSERPATFGTVEGWAPAEALPAPVMPGIRLKPRE